jgi:hypothetical protein
MIRSIKTFLIVILFTCTSLFGQLDNGSCLAPSPPIKWEYTVQVGAAVSSVILTEDNRIFEDQLGPVVDWNAGATAQYNLGNGYSNSFAIESGLFYVNKGVDLGEFVRTDSEGIEIETLESQDTYGSLQVPLHLVYKPRILSGANQILFFGGGYVAPVLFISNNLASDAEAPQSPNNPVDLGLSLGTR